MIKKDIAMLIDLCHKELVGRGYKEANVRFNDERWQEFAQWMREQSIKEFDRQVAERYCKEVLKTTIFPLEQHKFTKAVETARALRKLVLFQEFGGFGCGAPSKHKALEGPMAEPARQFLAFCRDELKQKENTLYDKSRTLSDFCAYAGKNSLEPYNLAYEPLANFITDGEPAADTQQKRSNTLRQFLRFLYEGGKIAKDLSVLIPKVKRRRTGPYSSVYSDKEIEAIVDSAEIGSAKGKRDYVALLLLCELGLRSSDVRSLKLDDIDWDTQALKLRQKKTGVPLELPMSGRLSNAIVAYLQHARPNKKTKARELLVQLNHNGKGNAISENTLYKTVKESIARAKIDNGKKRKCGPHAMRHSLATRMVGEKVAMPVIGAVLGHKSSESTKRYLSVAYSQLKQCALPMPPVKSQYYPEDEL